MLKNYFTVAFRNLFRNKIYSTINVLGLAIGMAACFFIFLYVYFEVSYDRFNKNADRLYRVPLLIGKSKSPNATNHPAVGPAMKAEFPEVEDFARLIKPTIFMGTSAMWYTDEKGSTKIFNESQFYLTDPAFTTMFSLPFVAGNGATSLQKPNSIIISESIAKKYFGTTPALDKVLTINRAPLKVTGVFKDLPDNAHMKFNMLISLNTVVEKWGYTEWGWPEFYNYVLLKPGADPKKVEAKLAAFVERHLSQKMKEFNFRAEFLLQPVTDIHLHSNYQNEMEPGGSEKTVYFLSVLGILILFIAWVNYINLSTAKSMERAREVGLRKVSGATRLQVIAQFIFESFLVNCIAFMLAVVIILAFAPLFDQLTGKKISAVFITSPLAHSTSFWCIVAAIFIAGAVQVGVYPAFLLSAFKPAQVLKGKFLRTNKGIVLRNILVSGQFVLSIALIAGAIIVYRQLHFMHNQQLGYNKDQLLVVKSPAVYDSTFTDKSLLFKEALLKQPGISSMAPSTEIPGKTIFARNDVMRTNASANVITSNLVTIDKDFVPTYQIGLAAGDNLPDYQPGDIFRLKSGKVLINEELATRLGFANATAALHQPVSFRSYFGDIKCEVVGVVKNYHQRSVHKKYEPILYFYNEHADWTYFSIHVQSKHLSQTIDHIKKTYAQLFPGNAFESFFMDEYFNRQYLSDERFGDIFTLFTVLAIFIACLGLIGLSTFAIRLRTKEIGVRKVLGATVQGIVYLFFGDFVKLVLIAAVIAMPVVYLAADKWLSNFAFHIQIGWMVFVAAPLLLISLAFITISIQSIKAALANPVKALRSE